MRFALSTTLLLLLAATQSGCMAVADVAYSDAVQRERLQCEKLPSMADHRMCVQRVNDARRQAEAQRDKK
jgi:hypothetical protein